MHRQRQQLGLGPVRDPTPLGDRVQHLRGSQVPQPGVDLERVVDGAGHEPNLGPTTDTFGPGTARIVLSTRGISKLLEPVARVGAGWFRHGLRFAPPGSPRAEPRVPGCRVVSTRAALRCARLNQGAKPAQCAGAGGFDTGSASLRPAQPTSGAGRARRRRYGWFRHGLRFAAPGSTNERSGPARRCGVFRHGRRFAPPGSTSAGGSVRPWPARVGVSVRVVSTRAPLRSARLNQRAELGTRGCGVVSTRAPLRSARLNQRRGRQPTTEVGSTNDGGRLDGRNDSWPVRTSRRRGV